MKTRYFKLLVAFLRYGFLTVLALIVAAIVGFAVLNWKAVKDSQGAGFFESGLTLNGLQLAQLNQALVEIPVRFGMNEAFTDTTITFDYPAGGGAIYRKERSPLFWDNGLAGSLEKHNQEVLAHYKAGQAVPRDTLIRAIKMLNLTSRPSNQAATEKLHVEMSFPRDVNGKVWVRMSPTTAYWWLVLANYLKALVPGLSFLLILWQLNTITKNFMSERIFIVNNFRRLRLIGVALLLSWCADAYYDVAMWAARMDLGNFRLQYEVIKNGVQQPVPFDIQAGGSVGELGTQFWIALLIIVFAEVFRRGVALQQEQELTV
jgi:Protein of unknown function (DUF2975)